MPTALQNINNFCEIFKLYLAAVFLTLKKKQKNNTNLPSERTVLLCTLQDDSCVDEPCTNKSSVNIGRLLKIIACHLFVYHKYLIKTTQTHFCIEQLIPGYPVYPRGGENTFFHQG